MRLLYILLLVLILVIGGVIIYSNRLPSVGVPILTGQYEKVGAVEDSITTVMDLISPYVDELGESNVAGYLEKYYNYSSDTIEEIHKRAERSGKKYLEMIIEEIMRKYDNAYEFIERSHLTFAAFLPPEKRLFICEPHIPERISSGAGGFSKLKLALDKFLRKDSIYLNDDTLDDELKNFLKINRKYRLLTRIALLDVKKIAQNISENGAANYELDVIALLPSLRAFAKQYETQYRAKQELKQLKHSLDDMGVLSLSDLTERLRYARSHDLATNIDHERRAADARRSREEAERRATDERRAADARRSREEAERRATDERRAADARRSREEAERRAADERRAAEQNTRRDVERRAMEERERRLEIEFHNRLTPEMEAALRASGFNNRQEMFEHFKNEMALTGGFHSGGWDEDSFRRVMRKMTNRD